jgi:hypothetical protein
MAAPEKSIMYLRGIRQDVVREAKAAAAREGLTLAAFVERAVARETRGGTRSPRLSEIAREMAWYEANQRSLVKRHEGEFLAILDEQVVDHDADLEALAARVNERYLTRSVYMPHCLRSRAGVSLRSPRIAR